MIKELITQPGFKDTPLGKKSKWWFYRLFEKVVSMFEYEGLPDSINRDYLETVLLSEGSIVWIKDKEGKLRALRGSHIGFDCYGFPKTANVFNPILGNLQGEFGKDAVWMRNNVYAEPIVQLIKEYSINLAQLDVNFTINLDNLKLAAVFRAENDAQAKQIKNIYQSVLSGEPAVITPGDSEWDANLTEAKLFGSGVQYLGSNFLTDRRVLINDFLTQFGIDNLALEKSEQMVRAEVDINKQELEINKAYWLKPRQDALDEINKLFGTNITVKLRAPEIKEPTEAELTELEEQGGFGKSAAGRKLTEGGEE